MARREGASMTQKGEVGKEGCFEKSRTRAAAPNQIRIELAEHGGRT